MSRFSDGMVYLFGETQLLYCTHISVSWNENRANHPPDCKTCRCGLRRGLGGHQKNEEHPEDGEYEEYTVMHGHSCFPFIFMIVEEISWSFELQPLSFPYSESLTKLLLQLLFVDMILSVSYALSKYIVSSSLLTPLFPRYYCWRCDYISHFMCNISHFQEQHGLAESSLSKYKQRSCLADNIPQITAFQDDHSVADVLKFMFPLK